MKTISLTVLFMILAAVTQEHEALQIFSIVGMMITLVTGVCVWIVEESNK